VHNGGNQVSLGLLYRRSAGNYQMGEEMGTKSCNAKLSIFSISLALIVLMSFVIPSTQASNAFGDGLDKKRDEVVELFRDRTGTKIKGVLWAEHDDLLVGVIKDGIAHGEVANYMCKLIADYGFGGKGITVHVIDFNELLKTQGGWVYLATVICK
jgi:hypothetical protein